MAVTQVAEARVVGGTGWGTTEEVPRGVGVTEAEGAQAGGSRAAVPRGAVAVFRDSHRGLREDSWEGEARVVVVARVVATRAVEERGEGVKARGMAAEVRAMEVEVTEVAG